MPGHLAPGHRAAGRYRLEAPLGQGDACTVWRCVDETLERAVALRFFDAGLDRNVLVERAGVAASLTHPHVVRIFDTGFDGGQFFTVCELLPGSLRWAGLPLEPEDAVRVGAQVAEALVYAHQRGIAHGSLHAGNVLMGEQGAKVADFAMSAPALSEAPATQRTDLVQLGELIYRALTGRDRSAPAVSGGRPLPDEPRGLATVVGELRDGAYPDAKAALSDLRALLPAEPAPPPRRWLPAAVAAVSVLLALASVGVATMGGRRTASPRPKLPPPITGKPFAISSVADFDPLADGREGHNTVARIADDSPQTFWSTERYRSSPNFSGRKEGVGVIVDLGRPRTAGKARVLFVRAGCSFQMRYSPNRDRDVSDWPTLATLRNAGTTSVASFAPHSSRWWLLWITGLTRGVPGAGGAFACGVADVALYPP